MQYSRDENLDVLVADSGEYIAFVGIARFFLPTSYANDELEQGSGPFGTGSIHAKFSLHNNAFYNLRGF